jgi:hypothetical protein
MLFHSLKQHAFIELLDIGITCGSADIRLIAVACGKRSGSFSHELTWEHILLTFQRRDGYEKR